MKAWSDLPTQKKNPRPSVQLNWEAEVVEYVGFLWQKTHPHGKKTHGPLSISLDIPFLGLWFVLPTYLHAQKRPGLSTITPDMQYIKPINIHSLLFTSQTLPAPCNACWATMCHGKDGRAQVPVISMVFFKRRWHLDCSSAVLRTRP